MPEADFSALTFTGRNEVVRIIAPNLLQLQDGEIVRLAGLEFPDNDLHEPGELALTAIKVLNDMLTGRSVELFQTKDKNLGRLNRMGHQIAHLRRTDNGAWVQGTLLALGLARVYTTPRNPEMATQMYALEDAARQSAAGLWAKPQYALKSPADVDPYENDFVIVQGKVTGSAINNNRYYINFGANWRDDFTLSIAPTDKREFTKRGLDPLQWGGRNVRVRGWVRPYNGAYMELTHPEQIEFLDETVQKTDAAPPSSESSSPLHHTP